MPRTHARSPSIGAATRRRGPGGDAGELGLHRAEASTRLENLASQQVLRRNGFRPFGVAREHIFLDGEWRDGLLWELTLGP